MNSKQIQNDAEVLESLRDSGEKSGLPYSVSHDAGKTTVRTCMKVEFRMLYKTSITILGTYALSIYVQNSIVQESHDCIIGQ